MEDLRKPHPLVGKTISINLKQITYFGVGGTESKDAIWLSPELWWDVVPPGLSRTDLNIIEMHIKTGKLLIGKIRTRAKDLNPKILSNFAEVLKNANLRTAKNNPFKTALATLVTEIEVGGYQTRYIIDQLIKLEQRGKSRKEVLALLEEAKIINASKFPQYVSETYDDPNDDYQVELPRSIAKEKVEEPIKEPKKKGRKSKRTKQV
jgi:hypothetical protein